MPLGKYYCDYCDKEFQDTPFARKRHLQSASHLRAKSLWFTSTATAEPSQHTVSQASAYTKGLCNRFTKTGFCPYGASCKYLHPSFSNTQNTAAAAHGFMGGTGVQSPVTPATQLVGGSSLLGDVVRDYMGMSSGNLPPSLKPPPEGGYPPSHFVDWG